jgi:4-hydroxybenzoate polyprenyltransferase
MRPRHWPKHAVLFAPLVFARDLFNPPLVARALLAFAIFCLVSGSVYLINDLADVESDRRHPIKRNRPLAAGKLGPGFAAAAAVILLLSAVVLSAPLGRGFLGTVLGYFLLFLAYSFYLKHVILVDVLVIAVGYFIRVVAGALAIAVEISGWLVSSMIFLALFLALCKRRSELNYPEAVNHRRILQEYSVPLLDQLISVATASTLISYTLYTVSPETLEKFHTPYLVLTVPFVVYGIFRYLYLVHQQGHGESPTEVFLTDRPLLADVGLWVLTVVAILFL